MMKYLKKYNESKTVSELKEFHDFVKLTFIDFYDEDLLVSYDEDEDGELFGEIDAHYGIGFSLEKIAFYDNQFLGEISDIDAYIKKNDENTEKVSELILDIKTGIERIKDEYPVDCTIQPYVENTDVAPLLIKCERSIWIYFKFND